MTDRATGPEAVADTGPEAVAGTGPEAVAGTGADSGPDPAAGDADSGGGRNGATLPPGVTPSLGAPTMRVVVVTGVRLDLPSQYPEILLQEAEAPWRELRIPVGLAEGTAIAYAWQGMETPRPLTHQLMIDVLDRHNVRVETVRITARRQGTYLAELETSGPRGREVLPCRPSDAVALVLRSSLPTPVLVAEGLFDDQLQPPTGPPAP